MTPYNATTVTGGATLIFLPLSFKDVIVLSEVRKGNQEIP